jgi:predicted methyltransferase
MTLKTTLMASALLAFSAVTSLYAADMKAPTISPAIKAAVSDAGRPEADTKRDEDRKPAEVVAFAGIKPGDKVADLFPGGGYFTRIFSKVVGDKGHVYAVIPSAMVEKNPKATDAMNALTADPGYKNVSLVVTPFEELKGLTGLDVAWTSDNYHDFHNKGFGPVNMTDFNKAVFNALKKGGIYMVIDHASAPGAGVSVTESLHRMDPEAVKAEVLAVGFQFAGDSNVAAHPGDDHSAKIFDGSIRGKTDQFVLKFKKP